MFSVVLLFLMSALPFPSGGMSGLQNMMKQFQQAGPGGAGGMGMPPGFGSK